MSKTNAEIASILKRISFLLEMENNENGSNYTILNFKNKKSWLIKKEKAV